MNGFALSAADKRKLVGLHPELAGLVGYLASVSHMPFVVLEGLRTLERQKGLVASGASKTLNSRHLTGHAVDIAPLVGGKPSWHWPHYHQLAPLMKLAALQRGVAIDWGGDWWRFKDGPHWELNWKKYPA